MLNYRRFLTELKLTKNMDVDKTPLKDAIAYSVDNIPDIFDIIPDFKKHYQLLIKLVKYGTHQRKDMPVIRAHDYENFKKYLTERGISFKTKKITIKTLKPSQKQIYLAKIIENLKTYGLQKSLQWMTSQGLSIVSSDSYIIDGHHRFALGILIDPNIKTRGLIVNVKRDELLKLALDYSDNISNNKRNESIR